MPLDLGQTEPWTDSAVHLSRTCQVSKQSSFLRTWQRPGTDVASRGSLAPDSTQVEPPCSTAHSSVSHMWIPASLRCAGLDPPKGRGASPGAIGMHKARQPPAAFGLDCIRKPFTRWQALCTCQSPYIELSRWHHIHAWCGIDGSRPMAACTKLKGWRCFSQCRFGKSDTLQ